MKSLLNITHTLVSLFIRIDPLRLQALLSYYFFVIV